MNEQWLTIAQAAERLQTSPDRIYEAIHTRGLKALRLGRRRSWRIHVEWLQAWAEAEASDLPRTGIPVKTGR